MSMQSILAASQSVVRMQTMQSARTQLQGTANILRLESKLDGGNEQKEAKANELEEKSNSLMGDLMSEANEVNEALKPDEDIKEDAASKEEETAEKPAKTDTVEFSDAATKYMGSVTPAKPTVSETVTYKADGSRTPSTPSKAAPAFNATA